METDEEKTNWPVHRLKFEIRYKYNIYICTECIVPATLYCLYVSKHEKYDKTMHNSYFKIDNCHNHNDNVRRNNNKSYKKRIIIIIITLWKISRCNDNNSHLQQYTTRLPTISSTATLYSRLIHDVLLSLKRKEQNKHTSKLNVC